MSWFIGCAIFAAGFGVGALSSRRGSIGAALGSLATLLAFIGLS